MTADQAPDQTDKSQPVDLSYLILENQTLKLQLEAADAKVGILKFELLKMENGQHELVVQLEDAKNEIGRLCMVLNHQEANLQTVLALKKNDPDK